MRSLRQGSRGREIVDLQTRLQSLGYELGNRGVDGVFRELTGRAVRSFQQEVGILSDGVVGPVTWRELVEAGYRPGGRLLYLRQPPFRGSDVVALQRMLNDLGFDPGAVNGLLDGRTTKAIREFQRNAGLQPDGVVDGEVFKTLSTYAGQSVGTHQIPDKNNGYFPENLFDGTIVVDAALGGSERGYVTPDGLCEANLNLQIAQALAEILPASEVLLTRDDDEYISPEDRAFLANSSGAKMIVSIHHASHVYPEASGTASFYFERHGYRSHRGRTASAYVQRGVSQTLGTFDIGEFGRSYDILRETNIPAVMLETLHLTNDEDLALASDAYYPTTAAEAIAGALELYAGRDSSFVTV